MSITLPMLLAQKPPGESLAGIVWGFLSVVLVETLVILFLVFKKVDPARFPLKSIRDTNIDAWRMNRRSVMRVLATALIGWGCIGICFWQGSQGFLGGSISSLVVAGIMILVPSVAIVVLRRKQVDARSAVQVMTIWCVSMLACWTLPIPPVPIFFRCLFPAHPGVIPAGVMLVLVAAVLILLLIRRVTATAKQSTAATGSRSPETMAGMAWHYGHDGTRFGPVSIGELRRLIASDKLCADDLVWRKGMNEWTPLGQVEGLFLPPPSPSQRHTMAAAVGKSGGKSVALTLLPSGQKKSVSTSQQSPIGSPSRQGLQRRPLKTIVIIGGSLVLLVIVAVVSLSRTSWTARSSSSTYPSSAKSSPSLTVPRDSDSLRHALEEADHLWDSGQKAEAARYYSAILESPCLGDFKEAQVQQLMLRGFEYYDTADSQAPLENFLKLAADNHAITPNLFNKVLSLASYQKGVRQIEQSLRENGIPIPEGGVTPAFAVAWSEGVAQAREMVRILQTVENVQGQLPSIHAECVQGEIDRCLKILNDTERENAEIADTIRAQPGNSMSAIQQRLGYAAGLRAEFRKAGIVR